jgi:HAMP domain-containing protein
MLSLRQKLTLGFGGLLAILATVGILSGALLTKYSTTIENLFRENYASVVYGQNMKEIVDELDDFGQMSLWTKSGGADKRQFLNLFKKFEENLAQEKSNTTVHGEREVTLQIEKSWHEYSEKYLPLMAIADSALNRQSYYREHLMSQAKDIKHLAQRVIDMNLDNIVSVDGQVKASTKFSRNTMNILIATGIICAILFIFFIGSFILKPLQRVTESAREIEKGNLDLVITVASKDEIGQLAEAFNSMTAKLREYRRSDRAQIFRFQRTTQLALNTFPDAVAIIGLDGKVELANEIAKRQFNLAPGVDLAAPSHKGLWNLFQEVFTTLQAVYPKAYNSAIQVFHDSKEHFFYHKPFP